MTAAQMAEIQADVVLLDAQVLTPWIVQALANASAPGADPQLAALERPVVYGPHMFNFAEISSMFLAHGAGLQVESSDELIDVVCRLFEDAGMRDQYGVHGRRLVEQNRGALDQVEEIIACELVH